MFTRIIQPTHHFLFWLLLSLGTALAFAVLNLNVPLFSDDYCRIQKVFSFTNAAKGATSEYFNWTGRWPVMFLNRVFLSSGSTGIWLLAIVNSAMLLVCVYLMLLHANVLRFHLASLAILVVFLYLFWFVPDYFGEVALWKTGHIQYFWGVCLALACLTPVIRQWIWHEELLSNRWMRSGFLFVSFITGMWLELVSVAVIGLWGLALISMWLIEKRYVPAFHWISLGFFISGCLVLVVAPGNQVRIDWEFHNQIIRYEMVEKIPPLFNEFVRRLDTKLLVIYLVFLVGSVLSGIAVIRQKVLQSLVFFLLSVLTALAILGAPYAMWYGRIAFPTEFFQIIATISVFPGELFRFRGQDFSARFSAVAIVLLTLTCGIILSVDYWRVYLVYESLNIQTKARELRIRDVLKAGKSSLELPPLHFGGEIHTGKGRIR